MSITNMFKRYLEDKWPDGSGGCVLISMKNIAPVDVYFPTGATVTEVSVSDDEGNSHTISAANYDRLYVDFRFVMGTGASAGPSEGVSANTSYPTRVNNESTTHTGFASTYLIPMFVPQGWRLANGTKGCVLGSTVSSYSETSYGSIPDENLPLKNLRYSAITNDGTDVNGVTKVSCVCQNKGTENATFTHIMLLSSTSGASQMGNNKNKVVSLFSSNQSSDYASRLRDYPSDSYNYYYYKTTLPLYYLDEDNVIHRLVQSSGGSYNLYSLFSDIKTNIQTNEYLTDVRYAALPIMAPMIIEELPAPVTLAPDDAYTISFTLDLSNREDWVRSRSNLDEGILYYSGSVTGQFPTQTVAQQLDEVNGEVI